MRYVVGKDRVWFGFRLFVVLDGRIRTCRQCGERYVYGSLSEGMEARYGDQIRKVLEEENIMLCSTKQVCSGCYEDYVAETALVNMILEEK